MKPTITEIDAKYLSLYCEQLLDSPLVESDSHEQHEDPTFPRAYMTKGQAFYFVPNFDNPVMGKGPRRLSLEGEPIERGPIPGRFHYTIETVKMTPGNSWEPDDYDLAEIGEVESIQDAIAFAAHQTLDWKIQGIGEGNFWARENEKEKLYGQDT